MAAAEQASTRTQAREAGRVLGGAYTDDPVWTWLLDGRANPEQRLTRVFTAYAEAACRGGEARVLLADNRGAALWFPPGAWKSSASDYLRSGPHVARALGGGIIRALRLLAAVERQHPTEPHWYLEAMGVLPDARGQRIGTTLLSPILDHCDEKRLPAYLESSNVRNVRFFERHGFVAAAQLDVPAGAPRVTPMWRDPR